MIRLWEAIFCLLFHKPKPIIYCDLALPKKILQQYLFQKNVHKSI